MINVGELSVALQLDIFRLDPKTKKITGKVFSCADPFVIAVIDAIYGSFANVSVNLQDTGGTTRSLTSAVCFGYLGFGDLGSTVRGILVGSGSTPVALSNFRLETLIAHGTGSGQLFYYQGLTEYITSISNKRIRLFQRPIANLSGANITVHEMGLVLESNAAHRYLLARNVITGGLAIQNNEYYLFQYSFEVAP